MNFEIKKTEGAYYVSDSGDMYGPFETYKEHICLCFVCKLVVPCLMLGKDNRQSLAY